MWAPRSQRRVRYGYGSDHIDRLRLSGQEFGVPQELVDEGDRHAAFADSGRDPLDGPRTDVAAREDARNARLEEIGISLRGPRSGALQLRAREHVPELIERDLPWEPAGFGVCSDEEEEPTRLESGRLVVAGSADLDRLQRIVAVHRNDVALEQDVDVGSSCDLIDQIARHPSSEAV